MTVPAELTTSNLPPRPLVYSAQRITVPISKIDGDILNKPAWNAVAWSAPFQDIRGTYFDDDNEDDHSYYTPEYHNCVTRMKMLWDDDYLYIFALLEYGVAVTGEEETHDEEEVYRNRKRVVYDVM